MPSQTHPPTFFISNFYGFTPVLDLEKTKIDLINWAELENFYGLWVIGPEGFNASVAADSLSKIQAAKTWISNYFKIQSIPFKDFESSVRPFRKFSVKIRPEIVTTGTPWTPKPGEPNKHLSPEEWNKVLSQESVTVIDTRNWYETQIGKFKGALVPDIEKFTEFPEYFKSQGIQPDQKILIYCTGGIRCEKGILELQAQGYNEVYQLDGGIIEYIRKFPDSHFEGECFVFDHRVAVDQRLNPSEKFKLCPHCGQPATQEIECKECGAENKVCSFCLDKHESLHTCSKNCAHHYRRQYFPAELHSVKVSGRPNPNAMNLKK